LKPGSSHVGFVVGKVALEQVFPEHFDFPCQSLFHQFHHHHLLFGAGTIGHYRPQCQETQSHFTNNNTKIKNLPEGEGLPVRKADNLTAISEPIVYKMWKPLRLTTLWASTTCYRDSFTFFLILISFGGRKCGPIVHSLRLDS
jgi:hypothetical protein